MQNNTLSRAFWTYPKKWRESWVTISLSQQFAFTSTVVLLGGMLVIGAWVAEKIETSVIFNTAVATALYMDSFVAPHAQDLSTQDILSQVQQIELDRLLTNTSIGNRIASFKIWKPGGLIAYSSRKEIIGNIFPLTENLELAWIGNITAEFDALEDEEDATERAANAHYLEIYSPIREKFTGRIIAVAEFYLKANLFEQVLFQAKLQSWLLVAVVTMVMLSLLFIIVHSGSRTIENQKLVLKKRVFELSDLRNRLKNASRRTTELNEQFLRQIGADLHDGPAQLLGLALLRLDALKSFVAAETEVAAGEKNDLEIVQSALDDALIDIRNISAGLVLPELDGLSLTEILTKAVRTHEYRTGTSISLNIDNLPAYVGKSTQICLYRMVQEGLNNSYHHAQKAPSSITARYIDDVIEVEIADEGSGFDLSTLATSSTGLGLPGLRERIESIGGQFEIHSAVGQGTQLIARLPVTDLENQDDE